MNNLFIKNARLNNEIINICIEDGKYKKIGNIKNKNNYKEIDANNNYIFPAFTDMHVHLREPGFEYKEDIESGSKAAVKGGFSDICCMPNTNPIIDSVHLVKYIKLREKEVDLVRIHPIASVTKKCNGEEMTDMLSLKEVGAIAFSDDGLPVKDSYMLYKALCYTKDIDSLIINHAEDQSLSANGCVNEGKNSQLLGLKGITRAAEDVQTARDIILAETLNTKIHIAHVSTKGAVQLIREAKARGVKVTCETGPHYFILTDDEIKGYNTFAKVNPPLREEEDRLAIIEGIKDGTIDAIITDHAPHSKEDKNKDMENASFGISGLETSFSLSYTYLVKNKIISIDKLIDLMVHNPNKILKLKEKRIEEGKEADFVIVDLNYEGKVDNKKFISKGKNTPFIGKKIEAQIIKTVIGGKIKYEK